MLAVWHTVEVQSDWVECSCHLNDEKERMHVRLGAITHHSPYLERDTLVRQHSVRDEDRRR